MTTYNRLIKEDSINSEELLESTKYAIRHLFWTQANYESDNPETISRKVEEKLGTREDYKNMSRKQFGTNTSNKN